MPNIIRKIVVYATAIASGLIGLCTLIYINFIEARWIPSGAMEPTLHGTPNQWEADKIIVDKLKYKFANPQRGDIILFSPTEELQKEQYQDAFIKRVIGLPGEKYNLRMAKSILMTNPCQKLIILALSRVQ